MFNKLFQLEFKVYESTKLLMAHTVLFQTELDTYNFVTDVQRLINRMDMEMDHTVSKVSPSELHTNVSIEEMLQHGHSHIPLILRRSHGRS